MAMDSASGIPEVIGHSNPEPKTSLVKMVSAASRTRRQSWLDSTSFASMRRHNAQVSWDMASAHVNQSVTASALAGLAAPPQSSIAARRNCRSRSSSITGLFDSLGTQGMLPPSAPGRLHIEKPVRPSCGGTARLLARTDRGESGSFIHPRDHLDS